MPPAEALIWLDTLLKQHIAPRSHASKLPHLIASESVVTAWHTDPFSFGSYTYVPAGDGLSSPLDMMEIAQPLWGGALGFAGEHTHVDRYASVHGAYETGLREGARIDGALREGD